MHKENNIFSFPSPFFPFSFLPLLPPFLLPSISSSFPSPFTQPGTCTMVNLDYITYITYLVGFARARTLDTWVQSRHTGHELLRLTQLHHSICCIYTVKVYIPIYTYLLEMYIYLYLYAYIYLPTVNV